MLAPQCAGVTTKTGELDVSVMVGDVARPWLHEVLRHMLGSTVSLGPAVFQLPVCKYETLFEKACKWLKLPLRVTPHVVRHSGASNDQCCRRRSIQQIQKRGRWQCQKSVARYEKEAYILQAWDRIPSELHADLLGRAKRFPNRLLTMLHDRTRKP